MAFAVFTRINLNWILIRTDWNCARVLNEVRTYFRWPGDATFRYLGIVFPESILPINSREFSYNKTNQANTPNTSILTMYPSSTSLNPENFKDNHTDRDSHNCQSQFSLSSAKSLRPPFSDYQYRHIEWNFCYWAKLHTRLLFNWAPHICLTSLGSIEIVFHTTFGKWKSWISISCRGTFVFHQDDGRSQST